MPANINRIVMAEAIPNHGWKRRFAMEKPPKVMRDRKEFALKACAKINPFLQEGQAPKKRPNSEIKNINVASQIHITTFLIIHTLVSASLSMARKIDTCEDALISLVGCQSQTVITGVRNAMNNQVANAKRKLLSLFDEKPLSSSSRRNADDLQ